MRRLLSIACRPAPVLLPHQQLVTVELEAPPPSPGDYVDMGPVSPNHYLQLQDHLDEEQESAFFLDAVSNSSISANLTLLYPFSFKQMLSYHILR